MKLLWQLFVEFFLIGSFSIGGGLATIPYLINLSDRTQWYTLGKLMDMIAVSESTPGPIAINMATYVGYQVSGILGSIIASIAVMITGVLFMIIVRRFLEYFKKSSWLPKVFYGLRPTIAALITFAAYTMVVSIVNQEMVVLSTVGLFVVSLILIIKTKLSPITLIVLSAIVSLFIPF